MNQSQEDILLRSKQLFERYGYRKTSLSDIAKSVGKVKTAIYYYFTGKEEIFAKLVKLEADTFVESLISKVSVENSAINRLELYVEVRMQLMSKVASRYKFLKEEFLDLFPVVEKNRADAISKEIAFVEQTMLEINASGERHIESTEFSSILLVNMLKGLEIQMYVSDEIPYDTLNIKSFGRTLLYGVLQEVKDENIINEPTEKL